MRNIFKKIFLYRSATFKKKQPKLYFCAFKVKFFGGYGEIPRADANYMLGVPRGRGSAASLELE